MSLVTSQNGLLFSVFSCLFVVVGSSFTLAANGSRLCVRAGFSAQNFLTKPKLQIYEKLSNEAVPPA
jgi:hypothetical protein